MKLSRKQRLMAARLSATVVAVVALIVAEPEGWVRLGAYLAVYLLIGYDILRKAVLGIVHGRVFDENFLMAVATIGAFVLAILEKSGDFLEAIAVMFFYQVGEFFQSYAVGKSRRDIAALMDIRPDYANVEDEDGTLKHVDPDDVGVGTEILVRPGEKVPIDGIVVKGRSTLDTSALTGESMPREVEEGSEVVSGSINLEGVLRVRTTKEFGESTVSRILEMVEDSACRKSKSEGYITRFARVYTPAVCYGALAVALLPPLFQIIFAGAPLGFATFETWIYRALVFLVISCPCALVVSIPLSFFAGIGGASREGVLVKGANILETLSKVKTVAFDKTGTLSRGVFEVTACHDAHDSNTDKPGRLLELAALVESASSHPIGRSLLKAYGRPVDGSRVNDIREVAGRGLVALVDGLRVAVGNDKLMQSEGVAASRCHLVGTIVHVAADGRYLGHIVVGDVAKPDAARAISDLRQAGVGRTVMLTGDSRAVANQIALQLGIDKVYSELLPADKVTTLEREMDGGGVVAFVGDGINDAPVLTRADVGIAMGALGSDAAIEAADVVLMDDNPLKVAKGIRIARKCLGIVRENVVMAIGIKGVCLVLGVAGIVNMWLAIFADVGVLILAVLNAMRAMYAARA